ncbi:MAG: tetratricopeptide repeat protein [Desulfobacterales bacterium]|nr:MAG: tetratricopeptide repeat protein [Desulfobacterales bacterium]
MSDNLNAQKKFEEGMADFVNHNYVQSIERLSQAIELDPGFALAFKSRGAAYLRLNQAGEAIADFNAVVELNPGNARAYHLRGLAYEKSGDNDKALDDFNTALGLDSNYGAAYFSRANLYNKMGNSEQATEDIRMVTHLTEVNIETFANDNNVWRSHQLRLESLFDDDLAMER